VDKSVVVAGGSGFIGRYVVQKLTEKGFRVLAPVRDLDKAQKVLGKHENVLLLDLNNPFLERVFKKYSPEVFINLVGILKEDKKQGITYEDVHFLFAKGLIDLAKEVGAKKFIQISACGVDKNKLSRYFLTKKRAEDYLIASGLDYLIFRPSIVIGKEQKLFEDLKRFIFLPLLVVPKIRVQPIHVLDLAEIILKGVEDKNFKNQICNVGGPRVIPMKELFHLGFQYLAKDLNLPKWGKYLVSKKLIVELPPKYFEPLLPILERLDIMDREQLLMTYTENICPNDNCAPKLLSRLRDISEFFKPKKEN